MIVRASGNTTLADMKRSASFGAVGIILCAILISGCAGNPRTVAETYLANLKVFNYPACYEALSAKDRSDRTIEQFLVAIPMAPDVSREWFKPIVLKTDYSVGEPSIEGNLAIVPVKVTAPDLAQWERLLDADQNDKDSLEKRAQDSLQQNHYPTITYDDTVVLAKESDGWKVVADFPLKESVATLHKQAVELYHKRDYDQAIAAYNSLLAELAKTPATGNKGLASRYESELRMIETTKSQVAEAQAYAAKVQLSNVDLKMTAAAVPGIFGKITNRGDKPVDEVRMTVTYYEGRGARRKAVYSEEHTPIDTPIEFSNFSRDVLPLAPNQSRDFGFRLNAPAEIQRDAKPDVAVTMVVFSQLGVPSTPSEAGAAPVSPKAPNPAPAAPQAPPPPMPKG
ncbi:MAG TPA: hypothetical protein VMB26_08450 [Candidatus Binataceae bacterium]|nr:hypothetical protein [Candidatus Binataceae bacterium]